MQIDMKEIKVNRHNLKNINYILLKKNSFYNLRYKIDKKKIEYLRKYNLHTKQHMIKLIPHN